MLKAILALLLLTLPASAQFVSNDGSGGGGGGSGTVTSLSVVTANGFAGTVATATTTPAITLTTTVTGNVCSNATALSACTTTGTGSTVLQTTPTLITPVLGVATATSVAINGATIGASALAVTGQAIISAGLYAGSAGGMAVFNSGVSGNFNIDIGNGVAGSIVLASGGSLGFTASAGIANTTRDTIISRNAAGVTQFGTTSANAAGSWLATNGTFTGQLLGPAGSNGTMAFAISGSGTGMYSHAANTVTLAGGSNPFFAGNASGVWTSGYSGFSNGGVHVNNPDATLSRNAAGVIQFGTTVANASGAWLAAKGTLTGGTLADQAQVLAITATQPASPTGAQKAITWNVTSAGSAAQGNTLFDLIYAAGYTGTQPVKGIAVDHSVAGTNTSWLGSASNSMGGNQGVFVWTSATTSGNNAGVVGFAQGGTINSALVGLAQVAKNSATNIGIVGSALNTGTTPVHIGGFFSLNQTTVPTVSAALIADNGAQTDPIFLARDNGVTVFTIADGGNVTLAANKVMTSTFVNVTAISSQTLGAVILGTSTATLELANDGSITKLLIFPALTQYGGTTSSFPAIKRSTTVLQFKLADDSAFTSFTATTGILNTLATDAGQTTATVCAENTTGQLYKGSGTIGICLGTSSARYKNRINNLTAGLSEIEQLQPKRFWYNKDAGDNGVKEQVGFMAEDVVKVLPNLVGLDSEGRPNTLDLVGMIPIIIKAIQELKADNDNLRATISRRAANGG